MKQLNNPPDNVPYNKAVKLAYFQILKEARAMLSTIEHEPLRYTLIREDKPNKGIGTIIHELVNPIIYLRLEHHGDDLYAIHYGFEQIGNDKELSNRTAFFTRSIFRFTSKDVTAINIEACIKNDWCIVNCSDLYAYIEERNKHHQFNLIKYKPTTMKRKQMKAA